MLPWFHLGLLHIPDMVPSLPIKKCKMWQASVIARSMQQTMNAARHCSTARMTPQHDSTAQQSSIHGLPTQ